MAADAPENLRRYRLRFDKTVTSAIDMDPLRVPKNLADWPAALVAELAAHAPDMELFEVVVLDDE